MKKNEENENQTRNLNFKKKIEWTKKRNEKLNGTIAATATANIMWNENKKHWNNVSEVEHFWMKKKLQDHYDKKVLVKMKMKHTHKEWEKLNDFHNETM